MFWALLRLILAESESGPKHIYAREHKLYCYIAKLNPLRLKESDYYYYFTF